MLNNWDAIKAVGSGMLCGIAIIIFVIGFFTSAHFVLIEVGKVMGCTA